MVSVSAEAAARGVKAADVSGTFSWRVVAKRKDVTAPRLAKFALPKVPAPSVAPPPEPKPALPETPMLPKREGPKMERCNTV